MDNAQSSARTSTSANNLSTTTSSVNDASQTHFHVVASSTVAAAIGSNHIHFDDTISIRSSDFNPINRRTSSPNRPPNDTSTAPTKNATLSNAGGSVSNTEKFLSKILPAQLMRITNRQRQRHKTNGSVSEIVDRLSSEEAVFHSAPTSPKILPQSGGLTRSSNESSTDKLQSLPLPALKSSESLPPTTTNRPILGITTKSASSGTAKSSSEFPAPPPPLSSSSPSRSPIRGRSSTVSSVSSDLQPPPRMSHSRTRRTATIFSNLKSGSRDSGRATPVEKLILDNDEDDEGYVLPPPSSENESGEEYFKRLQGEEGGLLRSIRKLVESQ